MKEFLLETTKGKVLRWILLLILLVFPLTQIASHLYSDVTREKGVLGTEQALPVEQKTPLGRILHAIDTRKDIPASRAIFEQEKNQLTQDVRDYLNKFFQYCDDYSSINSISSVRSSLSPYEHLITGAVYITKDMDDNNSASSYRAFEIIPFTFMKMAYKGLLSKRHKPEEVIDLCSQYQKSLVEPFDNISSRGASVFCVLVQLKYREALGATESVFKGILNPVKADQLKQLQTLIDDYKEKYPNSLGSKGNLKIHTDFLESYKKSAESIINEGIMDKVKRIIFGSKSDPQEKIPGFDI